MNDAHEISAVELATQLTVAWLGSHNTRVSAAEVPAFLHSMFQTVSGLDDASSGRKTAGGSEQAFTPAVSARKSLASPDHIISMIDGKPYKTLRRHLSSNGLTPEEYRQRYNLKADYPMVASSYSEARRTMANKIGLGRKPKQAAAAPASETAPAVAAKQPARGRAKKTSAEA